MRENSSIVGFLCFKLSSKTDRAPIRMALGQLLDTGWWQAIGREPHRYWLVAHDKWEKLIILPALPLPSKFNGFVSVIT